MSAGLAEYIAFPPCPYPPIVGEWDSIPDAQVATFTPPDFQVRDCYQGMGDYLTGWSTGLQSLNANGGLGDDSTTATIGSMALTSPGGYFASGGDFSQWGIAEWGTVILGVYTGLSLIGDTKRAARKTRKAARAFKSTQ
jgi:hypothetical protein